MFWFLVQWAWGAEPTLPVLVSTVPAVYPADALVGGIRSAVLLEIDITAEGVVSAVRVVESGGASFDAAAVQAARSFRFTPGSNERGDPVGATVSYRVVFEPSQAPPLSVEGDVRAAGTRERLAGVDVVLERGDERIVAVTDPDGHFRVAGLGDGAWTVRPDVPGFRDEGVPIVVSAGKVTTVRVFPFEDRPWEAVGAGVSEEVLVVGQRVAPEVTERTLTQEEVRYLPGTAGDVVRVVQNLPGADAGRGRGGAGLRGRRRRARRDRGLAGGRDRALITT